MVYVALQENNALAILDLEPDTFAEVKGLGFEDYSLAGNGFDASNRDGGTHGQTHAVLGLYPLDAIAT